MILWLENNKEFILGIATLIASVTAIVISVYQTKLSNKQQLFDRRLRNFMVLGELLERCEKGRKSLNVRPDGILTVSQEFIVPFIFYTSTNRLGEISLTIDHPDSEKEQMKFVKKMDEMEQLSQEISFIFPTRFALSITAFIDCYKEMLLCLFQCSYSISFDKSNPNPYAGMVVLPEPEIPRILSESYQKLGVAYDSLKKKKIDLKLKKLIRL